MPVRRAGRRRPPRPVLRVPARPAVAVCALVLVAGCAGSLQGSGARAGGSGVPQPSPGVPVTAGVVAGTTSAGGSVPAGTASSGGPSAAAGGPASASPTHRSGPRRVAWVPFGPATQGTPSQPASWYGALSETRDCGTLLDLATTDAIGSVPDRVRAVYLAMAHACLALAGNAGDEWSAAGVALARAGGAAGLDCLDRQVYRLTSQLLAAHEADPSIPVRTGPAGGGTACPYRATAVSPATGAEGDQVTITGHYLWAVTGVWFGDVAATDVQADRDAVTVTVPALPRAGEVRIRLVSTSAEGPVTVDVPGAFAYGPSPSSSLSPSATSSPGSVPTDSGGASPDTGTPSPEPSGASAELARGTRASRR